MVRPPGRVGASCGAELLSRSQMSWGTIWKCQRRLPVRASSAIRQLPNRFGPARLAPYKLYLGLPVGTYTMPRGTSIDISPQLLAPPTVFQASGGHVSYPNSP